MKKNNKNYFQDEILVLTIITACFSYSKKYFQQHKVHNIEMFPNKYDLKEQHIIPYIDNHNTWH